MPDDLDNLGSLIDEVKHTSTPGGGFPATFLTDPRGYLALSKGWSSSSSGQSQSPLPSEDQLKQLLLQLSPPPAAGAPDAHSVAADLENAAVANSSVQAGVNALAQLDWPSLWRAIQRLSSRGPTLEGQTYLEMVEAAACQAICSMASARASRWQRCSATR